MWFELHLTISYIFHLICITSYPFFIMLMHCFIHVYECYTWPCLNLCACQLLKPTFKDPINLLSSTRSTYHPPGFTGCVNVKLVFWEKREHPRHLTWAIQLLKPFLSGPTMYMDNPGNKRKKQRKHRKGRSLQILTCLTNPIQSSHSQGFDKDGIMVGGCGGEDWWLEEDLGHMRWLAAAKRSDEPRDLG